MVPPVPVSGGRIRRCSRSGCRWPASASLTFAYSQQQAWIEDLTQDPQPAAYDLCAAHAERLAVPIGWTKQDLRVTPPPVTPIRPDLAVEEQKVPSPAGEPSGESIPAASIPGA